MIVRKRIVLTLTAISLFTSIFSSAIAQNVTDVNSLSEENVTLTGESLQGIEPENINNDSQNRAKHLTEVTIEREKDEDGNVLKTGNEFLDSLMTPQKQPSKPLDEGLNKNQGDRPDSSGGTVPLVSF